MGMGFTVILLIFLFHLIETINYLLRKCNNLIDYINVINNSTISHQTVIFFGESTESINLLIDIIIVFVIIIIGLMVFLKIYWSIKEDV